jgi:hypothetical protein
MSRFLISSVAALLMFPAFAQAKTFPIPSDSPIATINIPDGWEPHEYDGGVEGTSKDGGVYLAVEAVQGTDVAQVTGEGIEWFAKQGVKIDPKSMKSEDTKLGGLPAFDLSFKGRDKDGPTEVGMTLVKTNANDRFLLIYYWGSESAQKDNAGDLQKIVESLTATK